MFQLSAANLHYIGDSEESKRHDLCVHGNVTLIINGTVIDDGGEWCVSASALRFMRSVLKDHFSGAEEHMLPCCGHFMIPSDDGRTVTVIGCPNGIDFDVVHDGDRVVITVFGDRSFVVGINEYKSAVLSYASQIGLFMNDAPSRIFDDELSESGYKAFMTEWSALEESISDMA